MTNTTIDALEINNALDSSFIYTVGSISSLCTTVLTESSRASELTEAVDFRPTRDQLYDSLEQWSDARFKAHYRLSKASFELLVTKLMEAPSGARNLPIPGTGFMRTNVLPPQHRVLIALRYLATPDLVSSLAVSFNVTKSTVFDCVTQVCLVIVELERDYINWPTLEDMGEQEAIFFSRYGFPGCIGCVDGTEIPITKPATDGEVYFNRKKRYSLNCMLTVNSRKEVIHHSVGSPGSYHDARVFRRSTLPGKLELLPPHYHILGDSAYPLSQGLMKPFRDHTNNPPRIKRYNATHSATRVIVEHANGLLKNKFHRLKGIRTRSVKRARLIIRACIVLHNFCIRHDGCQMDTEQEIREVSNYRTGPNEVSKRNAIATKIFA